MHHFPHRIVVYGLIAALALFSVNVYAEVRSITVGEETFEIDFETVDDVLARLNELARENPDLAPAIAAAAISVFADVPGFNPEAVVEAVGEGAPKQICEVVNSVNDVIEETVPGYPNCGEGIPDGGLEEQQSDTGAAGPGDGESAGEDPEPEPEPEEEEEIEDTEEPDPVSPS